MACLLASESRPSSDFRRRASLPPRPRVYWRCPFAAPAVSARPRGYLRGRRARHRRGREHLDHAEGQRAAGHRAPPARAAQGQGQPRPPQPPGGAPQPGSPFEEFFEEFFRRRGENAPNPREQQRRASSLGSGFIIDAKEGLVATNNHVIADADEVTVVLGDGTKLKAEIVGRDQKTDIALLKVKSEKPLKDVKFGDFGWHPPRRMGDRDRQSVRPRRHRDARHRLGAQPRHQERPLRQLHSDRRLDQSRQLGRPAVQPQGRSDRHQHGDHLAVRRLDRHRLLGAVRRPRWR